MNTQYKLVLRFETGDGTVCAITVPHADTDMDADDVRNGMLAMLDADAYEHKGSPLEDIHSAELVSTQAIAYNMTP